MKKLVLFLFVFGLLAVAGTAAYPYLSKALNAPLTVQAGPPSVEAEGQYDFPIDQQSLLAVRLELPMSAMAAAANSHAPEKLEGAERRNLHKLISNGTVQWRMIPGDIALKNNGRNLGFAVPIQGAFRATGDVDASIIRFPIDGQANIAGHVTGTMAPKITPEWQIQPNLDPSLKLSSGTLTLSQLGLTFDATQIMEELANPLIKEEAAKVGPEIMQGLDLEQNLQKLWDQAHLGMQVYKKPDAWLVFDPSKVSLGPFNYINPEILSVTVGMEAHSYVSSTPVNLSYPEKLPLLEPLPTIPYNDIKIPFVLGVGEINKELSPRVFETTDPDTGASAVFSKPEIRVGKKGVLYLGITINAESGGRFNRKFSGRVWIEGKPELNVENQTLGLSGVKLTEETQAALPKTTAKIMDRFLTEMLEEELKADFAKFFPEVNRRMQEWLRENPIAEGMQLYIPNPEMKMLDLYTVNRPAKDAEFGPAIVTVLGGKGDVILRINQF